MQPTFHHFGAMPDLPTWAVLAERLKDLGVKFLIKQQIRFTGQAGKLANLLTRDPSSNTLEFKAFAGSGLIFEQ